MKPRRKLTGWGIVASVFFAAFFTGLVLLPVIGEASLPLIVFGGGLTVCIIMACEQTHETLTEEIDDGD